MKTLTTCWFLCIVTTIPGFSQYDTTLSDLEIAKRLINQPAEKLASIIENFNYEIYITNSNENSIQFYLQRGNNSVRSYVLKIGDIYKETDSEKTAIATNICREVFVRYYHENLNDLRDFYSYDTPASTKYVTYEKSLGEQKSHLRITMNDY